MFAIEGGLFSGGGAHLVLMQLAATVVTFIVAIVGTLVCLGITSAATGGLRVAQDDEFAGLDLSEHSENAYVF